MKKLILTISILTALLGANAQQSLTLYNMDMISQSNQINPSMMPGNRHYFGIPALSGTRIQFTNSGFTWRDLHRVRTDDSVSLDIDNAISKLADNNFISFGLRVSILETGFTIKKNYFSFNVAEKINFNLTFPKEMFELLLNGNAQFIGRQVDLTTNFDLTHYREFAVGITRPVSKKVTMGAKLKYLYGMENISSGSNNFSFYTAPDDYRLELNSEYRINTSLPANGGASGYIGGLKNTGFGADLGVTYAMNEKWKLNASIVDLGYIKWKSNVKNLTTVAGSYTFEGIDIAEFMSDSSSMENVGDSISEAFTPVETEDAYKTSIPAHYYANVTYIINEKTNVAGLFHGESFKGSFQPSFTASLNKKITDHFSASLSYSVFNHTFDNVGAGLVFHAGAFQFYMISDNWIGTINPLSNHTAQVNFGFNLVWGRPKKKAASTMPSVTAIPEQFQK